MTATIAFRSRVRSRVVEVHFEALDSSVAVFAHPRSVDRSLSGRVVGLLPSKLLPALHPSRTRAHDGAVVGDAPGAVEARSLERLAVTGVASAPSMDTIRFEGRDIAVREVARPSGWSCRVLVARDGEAYLEYLVSVGPYSFDVPVVHRLRREELEAFQAGALDLGEIARALAHAN
jgi:hypothetical protein